MKRVCHMFCFQGSKPDSDGSPITSIRCNASQPICHRTPENILGATRAYLRVIGAGVIE